MEYPNIDSPDKCQFHFNWEYFISARLVKECIVMTFMGGIEQTVIFNDARVAQNQYNKVFLHKEVDDAS